MITLKITKREHPKTYAAIAFAGRGRTKNRREKHLAYLYYNAVDGHIVGSNGKRLHYAEVMLEMPTGCYDVKQTKRDITLITHPHEVTYPPYLDVFPTTPPKKRCTIDFGEFHDHSDPNYTTSVAALMRYGLTLRVDYLHDTQLEGYAHLSGRNRPVYLEGKGTSQGWHAVIMQLECGRDDPLKRSREEQLNLINLLW